MKFLVVLAAVAAVSSAQFHRQSGFASSFAKSSFGRSSGFAQPAAAPVATARSGNPSREAGAQILRQDSDILPDGSYTYAYETDNGIAAQAQGQFRDFGGSPPAAADVAQGSFSWTSPEGQPISISYVADENGYRATGNALPTPPAPPAIPPQIARALEYIARNAARQ